VGTSRGGARLSSGSARGSLLLTVVRETSPLVGEAVLKAIAGMVSGLSFKSGGGSTDRPDAMKATLIAER
jgi:hypothetical protein